jgi:hypothetical protein
MFSDAHENHRAGLRLWDPTSLLTHLPQYETNRTLGVILTRSAQRGHVMSTKKVQQDQGPLGQVFHGTQVIAKPDSTVAEEERRHTTRRRLSIPVWIRLVSGNNISPAQARQLIDISPTGLGVMSKAKLKPGQSMMVELCINNTTWSGPMKVVHCTETGGGYKIGLKVASKLPEGVTQAAEDNRGRKPSSTATFKKLQEEIPRAMRAYRQARVSWGLLGTPVKNNIMQIVCTRPPLEEEFQGQSQRRHIRRQIAGDVHLVVPTYYGGKWLQAQILDISEGGAGLSIPFNMGSDEIERELSGDLRIAPKVPVILGIGSEPNIIWLPAEITRCSKPQGGEVCVGLAFNTPAAQAAFGA